MSSTSIHLGIFTRRELSRNGVLAAILLVGLANGFAARMVSSVLQVGWADALAGTFDISAIIWISCVVLIRQILKAPPEPIRPADLMVGMLCLVAFMAPIGQIAWLALTGLSAYMMVTTQPRSPLRGAAYLLLAVTLPMLWARLLLSAFSGPILAADASVVAALVGTQAVENIVLSPDGSPVIWISPACSSVVNVALTILCGATFVAGYERAWSWKVWGWSLLAIVAIMAVNLLRLSLLALYPAYYDLLHGAIGGSVFNLLMVAIMVGIFWYGVGREHPATV